MSGSTELRVQVSPQDAGEPTRCGQLRGSAWCRADSAHRVQGTQVQRGHMLHPSACDPASLTAHREAGGGGGIGCDAGSPVPADVTYPPKGHMHPQPLLT